MPILASYVLPIIIILGIIIFVLSRYKVARVDQVLIVTGGKSPRIVRSGGGIVWPIIRKHSFFDLCIRTIVASDDVIKTKTGVPVVVSWTAQIRPDSENADRLRVAATSFLERNDEQIRRDIKYTLDGSVREVVADMTPEAVMREKEEFSKRVRNSVNEEMHNLGFLLVSLNIQDVTDKEDYYNNLAAGDREERRREAENITAAAEQSIREKRAAANQAATEAELNSEVAIASRTRDTEVKKAEFQVETDRARADAEIAGQLREAERQKELATNTGQIKVEQQVQEALAAEKRKEVVRIDAEADKVQIEINAGAQAEKAKIDADAKAAVLQKEAAGQAEADKTAAEGKAEATRREAYGEADAVKAKADAEAQRITQTGTAEANIIEAKGRAEAEAIKARGLAEAEAESAKADALAKNEGVNLQVALAEIYKSMQVEVSTNVGKVMAGVGEKTTIYDFGGDNKQSGATSALTNYIGDFPRILKEAGLVNTALHGESFNDTLKAFLSSVFEPMGALNKETKIISEGAIQNGLERPPIAGSPYPADPGE